MATAAPETGRKRLIRRSNSAFVPEMSYYEEYISRTIGGQQDFQIARYAFEVAKNMLIEGPTGPGKTSFALAVAAKDKRRFFAVPSSGAADPSQLFGKFNPNPDRDGPRWIWSDGGVTQIVRHGGVLLINEVNTMLHNVGSVLFELADKRRQITLSDKDNEVVRAHRPTRKNVRGKVLSRCWCDAPDSPACRSKWVLLMADMNPGYEGTRPLSKALTNRFQIKLWWDYDPVVEESLVVSEALRKMAKLLRDDHAKGKYVTPVSTNMLFELEENLMVLGRDLAGTIFVNTYPSVNRAAVQLIVNTHMDNIEAELRAGIDDTKTEPPDFDKMTPAQIQAWRLQLKPGEVDPEWGIYMDAWFWDEAEGDEEVPDE